MKLLVLFISDELKQRYLNALDESYSYHDVELVASFIARGAPGEQPRMIKYRAMREALMQQNKPEISVGIGYTTPTIPFVVESESNEEGAHRFVFGGGVRIGIAAFIYDAVIVVRSHDYSVFCRIPPALPSTVAQDVSMRFEATGYAERYNEMCEKAREHYRNLCGQARLPHGVAMFELGNGKPENIKS